MKRIQWAYGVTTVPQRVDDLLPRTLQSLKAGGFDKPKLFVDGVEEHYQRYRQFGLDLTIRKPGVRTAGNWMLTLLELYVGSPEATHYAVFQDDLVAYRNLRQYLEQCKLPEKGYWNLYTFPRNEGQAPGKDYVGWYQSNQRGLGALATVYGRDAVATLLCQEHLYQRVQDVNRGFCSIDGGIVTAMKKVGWSEYVHLPSLVQHTGQTSTMGHKIHELASSFRGEDFDAMELVPCQPS